MPQTPLSPWVSSQDEVQPSAVTRPCGNLSIISAVSLPHVPLFSPLVGSVPSHTGAGPSASIPSCVCQCPLVCHLALPLVGSAGGFSQRQAPGCSQVLYWDESADGVPETCRAAVRSPPPDVSTSPCSSAPCCSLLLRQIPGAVLMPPRLASADRHVIHRAWHSAAW